MLLALYFVVAVSLDERALGSSYKFGFYDGILIYCSSPIESGEGLNLLRSKFFDIRKALATSYKSGLDEGSRLGVGWMTSRSDMKPPADECITAKSEEEKLTIRIRFMFSLEK